MYRDEIASIDLNLLVVLEALLLERHVTRAARRVHRSQPAVSRALAELRGIFDDPLLVRVGQQMQPTEKAIQLLPALQRLLEGVRDLVSPPAFNPAQAGGVIRLAAPDIVAYMLVPLLLDRLQRDAPRLDLEIMQWSPSWYEQLASGEVDLTFGQARGKEAGIYESPLIRNEWATVLRKGHPALRERWSAESFAKLQHLMIGFTPHGGGQVDNALATLGFQRRVALRMPYVVLSPLIIAESDLVLTTARWLAEKLATQVDLVIKPPPLSLEPVDLPLVWHERSHHDPKQRWLRQLLRELSQRAGMAAS